MAAIMNKALFILSQLNTDDVEWMIEKGRLVTIPANTTLIREGEKINALYLVVRGSLSVYIEPMGHREEIAWVWRGEIVGEISFIDDRPTLASVRAVEDTIVLAISRVELMSKIQKDLGFASRFYRGICMILTHRMRDTVQRLGYHQELETIEAENVDDDINPAMLENLELAVAKLNWLMESVMN
ncbi:MAG: hypothetical protein Fur0025_13650 [Oscillatoriaceae cyanobacterium]